MSEPSINGVYEYRFVTTHDLACSDIRTTHVDSNRDNRLYWRRWYDRRIVELTQALEMERDSIEAQNISDEIEHLKRRSWSKERDTLVKIDVR